MKILLKILFVPITLFTLGAGCTALPNARTINDSQATEQINNSSQISTETTLTYSGSTMEVSIPTGWEKAGNTQEAISLSRPDPEDGISEGEYILPNQGSFRLQIFEKGSDGYNSIKQLIDQETQRQLSVDGWLTATITAEENVTISNLVGKRYFITNTLTESEVADYIIETVLVLNDSHVIQMVSHYGNGSDSEQIREDILAIQNSLEIQ